MAIETVAINGAEIAYEIAGPKDAPLIITLHGGRGMGDHRSDFEIFGRLSDQYRVLSFDFRGHGKSSRTKPYTFKQLVDDIEGVRKHFSGDDQAIVIGGSFGGFLAQQYAIEYASCVSHLVLRGTAASHHHEEGAIKTLEARIHRAPSFSTKMLRDKVFRWFEDDEEFRLVHFSMMPLYREDFNPDTALLTCRNTVYVAESHNKLYSAGEKYFDFRDQLHRITAKTLVVAGALDWICPPENSKEIAAGVRNAELVSVPNANHSVHVEQADFVLGRIRSFIGS